MSIAPWQVHVCAVRADNPDVKACADEIYCGLQNHGIEVLYDDREVSAGIMFSDADLLGIPLRAIVSPRNMKEGCCEIVTSDKKISIKVPVNNVIAEIQALISDAAV
ncbi:MAG: hypothetical protein LBU32_25225 [Clostridiales bacterium]|jgi:prolyl-tRNA synthetase|nr:hypothetical protein [Clostridiales bacterium]